jgi:hypothetical protein
MKDSPFSEIILLTLFLTLSLAITATAFAQNSPPVAYAGEDHNVLVNESVVLHGSATDPDDDDIAIWDWMIVSQPLGGSPSFPGYYMADPTFQANVAGNYILCLQVNDGTDWSEPDYVTIHVIENLPPAAVADSDTTSGDGDSGGG